MLSFKIGNFSVPPAVLKIQFTFGLLGTLVGTNTMGATIYNRSNANEVHAQTTTLDSVKSSSQNRFGGFVEAQTSYTSNDVVPFWLRANQFGSNPLPGISGSFLANLEKRYSKPQSSKFDWAAGVEARVNQATQSELLLIQAYIKAKAGIFELSAGRLKNRMGLVDTTLSTGAFAVSGNALGIPQVQVAVPEFWQIPLFNGLFSAKGNFTFGWYGYAPLNPNSNYDFEGTNVPGVNSKFHQKSFYLRLGRPNWRLHLIGGFNHQTVFGNEDDIYQKFNLSTIEAYYYAISGKTWFANNGASTKLGNQLGSIDFGLTYSFTSSSIFLYRQQFYDVGALAYLANVRDGLNGISLTNKKSSGNFIQWKKLVFEFLYSKNQAGELWSKRTPSGDEAYYNNFMYANGWSYRGDAIGNPLFTARHDARGNLRYKDDEYFINNRIIAYHGGVEGSVGALQLKVMMTYSKNYGTYGTSPIGTSRGRLRFPLPPPYFSRVNQFSGYANVSKEFSDKWQAGLTAAVDTGKLLYNSYGLMVNVRRTF